MTSTTATNNTSSNNILNSFDLEQITTDPAYHTYLDLFSCASLRIGEEDWNSLVSSGTLFISLQVSDINIRGNECAKHFTYPSLGQFRIQG